MKTLEPRQLAEIQYRRNWGWSAYKLGKEYGVSPRHIRRLLSQGQTKLRPCGRKTRPITAKEIDRYIMRRSKAKG